MRFPMRCLILCLALMCSACSSPQLSLSAGGHRGWGDSPFLADRDPWLGLPGYGRSPFHRPPVVCDRFGRCWRAEPSRFSHGHFGRPEPRPPGWAESLPESAPMRNRFLRPRSEVVCDRATRICYNEGNIDKSDTKDVFGRRAGKRADKLRDQHGTPRVFAPERDVSCDRERRRCFDDGAADRDLTRRYFGRRAARGLK